LKKKQIIIAAIIASLTACGVHPPPSHHVLVREHALTEEDLMHFTVELTATCVKDSTDGKKQAFCECMARSVVENIRAYDVQSVEALNRRARELLPNDGQAMQCIKESRKAEEN